MAVADQRAVGSGSFRKGFDLALFQSSNFDSDSEIDENTTVYIGSLVYVQAAWSVSSLRDKIHFYVDHCSVNQGEYNIDIVKAGMLNNNYLIY